LSSLPPPPTPSTKKDKKERVGVGWVLVQLKSNPI
jgi:hypothetical protein